MNKDYAQMEIDYEKEIATTDHNVQRIGDVEKAKRRKEKGLPPNPHWNGAGLLLDYQDIEFPIGGRMRGVKEFLQSETDAHAKYTKIGTESFIVQAIRHEDDEIQAGHIVSHTDDQGLINRYTLYFDVKFDSAKENENLMGLFTTLRLTDDGTFKADGGAGILVSTSGEMGVAKFMGAFSQVPRMTWCLITVSVDCVSGVITCFCNENKVWEISGQPECLPGGAFAIEPNAGIGIF